MPLGLSALHHCIHTSSLSPWRSSASGSSLWVRPGCDTRSDWSPTTPPSACSPPSGRVSSLRSSHCRREPCLHIIAAICWREWCPTSTDSQDLPLRVLQPVAVSIGGAALAVAAVATLLPSSAAVLAITLAVAAVVAPVATSWANRRAEARLAAGRAELTANVVTLLNARADLVAYGAAAQHLAQLRALDAKLTRIARSSALAAGVGAGLAVICAGGAVWGALALGTSAVRDGTTSGVTLAVVVLIPLAAFEAVQVLPTAMLAFSRSRQSGERVIELLDTPAPVGEPTDSRRLDRWSLWPISLRGAGASWPGSDSSTRTAVSGVDLELNPGRTIAVVGENGAGKTTLSAILLRFVELNSGSYRLGGVDAHEVSGDEVRRMVGLCAQDAHIFDSTIRENLRRPVRMRRRRTGDVLRRVRLLAWVDRLPDGLGTHLGEGGHRLSEGNVVGSPLRGRRRRSSRRSCSTNPTANLDQSSAERPRPRPPRGYRRRATVLITHRLSELELVDENIVLEAGAVAERGSTSSW